MAAPSSQRVLITGIRGFTGRYLSRALTDAGYDVHGIATRDDAAPACPANEHVADLLDAAALRDTIIKLRPDKIVHLAAISFVAHDSADAIYRTNIVGTRNLLAAATAVPDRPPQVLLASSANVYGNADVDPIDEQTPPSPANDYAVSKLAMEQMARLWSQRLPITVVRPFNYTGLGQPLHFLLPKIVDAYRRRAPRLELGNLDVARDFSDVRDVVDAYVRLLDVAPAGTFNVCSGTAVSLHEILVMATELTGHAPEIAVNAAFVRDDEVRRLRGSCDRLQSVIGSWQTRPLRQTLEWMLAP